MASQVFYLLTMGMTNLSLTLLMRRIFSTNTKHKLGSYILLGVISAWLVLAVIGITANCPPTHILDGEEHTCPNDVCLLVVVLKPTDQVQDLSMESYSVSHHLLGSCRHGTSHLSREPSADQVEQEDACCLCFHIPYPVSHTCTFSLIVVY